MVQMRLGARTLSYQCCSQHPSPLSPPPPKAKTEQIGEGERQRQGQRDTKGQRLTLRSQFMPVAGLNSAEQTLGLYA